jgi:hypothetical protein
MVTCACKTQKEAASTPKTGKTVKIHGYVTAVRSPNDFEIEDYRIIKDSNVIFELEKSDDPDEKATFDASEIQTGRRASYSMFHASIRSAGARPSRSKRALPLLTIGTPRT